MQVIRRTGTMLTLSVVSHGHGPLLTQLLRELDALESLRGAIVLVTLNIRESAPKPVDYRNIDLMVLENAQPRGFGANHNAAFRECRTPWFVVINPDLRIPEGHDPFRELLRQAENDDEVALVVPLVVNSSGDVEDSVRSNLTPQAVLRRRLRPSKTGVDSASGFRWYAGMCMAFRAAAYRAVHGFDERYFLYCEDYDICARLHLAGYKLKQVPGSRVVHDAQRDSHRSFKHFKWHMQSLLQVWLSRPFWQLSLTSRPVRD